MIQEIALKSNIYLKIDAPDRLLTADMAKIALDFEQYLNGIGICITPENAFKVYPRFHLFGDHLINLTWR
jgi:hypothetical protein